VTGLPMGANVAPDGVTFRVWAPAARSVELDLRSEVRWMERSEEGSWSLKVEGAKAGVHYAFSVDGRGPFPDPYSRFQPDGVHGASQVVDPWAFDWHDDGWPGLDARELVIYECHIGCFTPAGTFDAAIERLGYLKELGVTALEIMPVGEFSGSRNWGYDGVDWFAPSHSYGGPEGLRRLVDAAHRQGLGVLLDVVYNHFGPEGNYLREFSPDYFTSRYQTPWGDALNYDGPNSQWMRQMVLDNAVRWLREYHVDGFRCDATFAIMDASPKHMLRDLAETVRAEKPNAVLIAETHENDARYLRGFDEDGFGFDAVWADDFHHVIRRRIAGDSEGYYRDYTGTVEELARTANQGFLYEGQVSPAMGHPRGKPARDRPAYQFVYCIQNHDQVGNRPFGDRLNHGVEPDLYRLASAVLLLLPYTPMLFMGQEFAASTPFQYFTDHSPDLGKLVTEGRREEFKAFSSFSDPSVRQTIPDPQAEETFARCKLPWPEADGSPTLRLYRECLRLRREDPVLRQHDRFAMRAWAPTPNLLAVRFEAGNERRLLLANFGPETAFESEESWSRLLLSTEAPEYGGSGQSVTLSEKTLNPPSRALVLIG